MRSLLRLFALAFVVGMAALPNLQAQCVSLTTLGSAYTQNFDTLSNAGTTNNLAITGWSMTESGGGARDNEQYAADTGGSGTGDTFSYGSAASTDRALGGLQSGTLIPIIGACFTNNTGGSVTSADVAYVGEEWRLGTAARTDRIDFEFSVNATSLTTGTWSAVDTLDFTTPVTATTGAKDGNAAANRTAISSSIGGLSIANGASFWIRWTDLNASGADDGLAVDDFSLTPQGPPPVPTLNVNDVSMVEGDAGTSTYSFTVSLTVPAALGGVTFDIATADNTATTADNDYVAKSLTGQTIPFGSSTYTFDVTASGDTAIEPNESFLVNVTNLTGATAGDTQGEGTILNDDSPPDLTVADVSIAEGNSGTTALSLTVQLSAPARAGGATFDIATADGTATAPGDYTASSLVAVTILEGGTSYTFNVDVNGDTSYESNETLLVNVTNVTGATVVDGQATATITNDDAAPTLSIADGFVTEGDAGTQTMTFTVTLSAAIDGTVTVDYTTADSSATTAGGDYLTAAGTLTFAPSVTTQTFDVTVNGDTNSEGNEQFLVDLTNPVNATILDAQALGIILLDDPFSIAAVDTTYSESFDGLAQIAAGTTPMAWTLVESPATSSTYRAGTGTDTAGDTYSFGSAGSGERAFGTLQSNSLAPTIGAYYRNDTGVTITNLFIGYAGELWRLGATGRIDRSNFQFSTDATSLTTGSWNDVDLLDLTTPNTTGSVGARNGNDAAYRSTIAHTMTALSIPPGGTFWIRWTDLNISGSDDGLGVDDFSIAANITASMLSIDDVAITEGNSGTSTMTFTVSLSAPQATDVTFDITTADGTATVADNDYVANTLNDVIIPGGNTSYTFDVTINGDVATDPTETFTVTISNAVGAIITDSQGVGTIYADDFTLTPIHDVQGSGLASPLAGTSVTVAGIVTGIKTGGSGGFFVQEPDASIDADPNTSEGIFIFTGGPIPAGVAIGNRVAVTGTVSEYPAIAAPHTVTELGASLSVSLLAAAEPLPGPAVITTTDAAPSSNFSQYERFEGMRVTAPLTAVTGTDGSVDEANANGSSNGVFYAVVQGIARPFRELGLEQSRTVPSDAPCAACIPRFDENPEKLRVDSDNQPGSLQLNVVAGQTITNLVGVLDFGFNEYTILPEATATAVVSGSSTFTAVPAAAPTEVTIGSFNLERFYDTVDDPNGDAVLTAAAVDKRLNKASAAIAGVLGTPDVLGIVEVENLAMAQALAGRVNALTGTTNYVAYLEEGNDVGGIDVGFLVNENRVTVNSVTQVGKTATFVNPDTGLNDMLNDRPPLVLEASIVRPDLTLFDFTVIVNHLRSLNGIDTDDAAGRRVRAKRAAQAEYLASLVQTRQVADPAERIVLVGDFNAFEVSDGYVDVIGTILGSPAPADQVVKATSDVLTSNLTDLLGTLPSSQQYSYLFDGNAQTIDHGIVNAAMLPSFTRMAYGRVDADFPEIFRTDGARPERISDHDGLVAYFDVGSANDAPVNIVPGAQAAFEDTALVFSAGNGNAISVTDPDAAALDVEVTLTVTDGSLTLASLAGLTFSIGDGVSDTTMTFHGSILNVNTALAGMSFVPSLEFSGPAVFTINTNDLGHSGDGGALFDTDTVAFDVAAVNDAPSIAVPGAQATAEGVDLAIAGVSIADIDVGAGTIQVSLTSTIGTLSATAVPGVTMSGIGTAALTLQGTLGAVNTALAGLVLTPPADLGGIGSITIVANDSGFTGVGGPMTAIAPIAVTVTDVNDAPALVVPGAQTLAEDASLTFTTAGGNAIRVSDIDSAATPVQLSLTTTTGTFTTGAVAGVTVIGNGTSAIMAAGPVASLDALLQTLVLTAPTAVGGTGTITVSINDLGATGSGGPLTATATINVTITDVNDAPTVAVPGAQTTNEGVDLVFATANGNAISVADIDAGTGDVQLSLTTTIGTLTLGSTAGLTTVAGSGTAAITATGPLAAINAALQGLTVTVPTLVGGTGTLSVTIDDLGLTGTPGALSASANVAITVNDVNDPPTITVPAAQTTAEGTNLVFAAGNGNTISVTDSDAAAGSIQLNLSTTAGTLTLGSTAGLTVTGNGTAAITATGPVAALNAALQGLTLAVSSDISLTGTITVTANDLGLTGSGGPQSATAMVGFSVTDVDDAPTLTVPAAQTTAEGADLVFVTANGNSITVADVDAGTGAIRLTLTTTTGTLTLGSTAGLTVAGNGSASVIVNGPLAAINAALQGLTFAYTADTAGSATITLLADDLGLTGTGGPLTATASITVTITDVNDAPTIAAPPSQTTPEDVNLVFAAANGNAITIADVDAGTGEVQITLTTTIGTLTLSSAAGVAIVGNGTASVTATGTVAAINAALEGLTLAVPAATSGTGTLTINVTDQGNTGTGGALTATANVAITIDSINDPPAITIPSLNQDGTSGFVIFSASRGNGITISDPDADTSPIEITLTATCGTITLGSTAGLTFTAGDGTGDSTMTFTGTITSINAALEGMRFAVDPGCTGSATLVVSVNDLGATGTNGAQFATATINISAAAVAAIPTLSFFGLLALGLALIAAAGFRLK